jgi:outer membrane protein assembly factor BamE (lipoprotein component of BamABCDE complex)
MKHILSLLNALLLSAALSACVSPAIKDNSHPADLAQDIRTGDTQEQVSAKLGKAEIKTFPSGYQVWVYKFHPQVPPLVKYLPVVGDVADLYDMTQAKKEFAILFDVNGKVKKTVWREQAAAWSATQAKQ